MRANHVICVDFQLRLGQKLAVFIQQKRLANLITIGFLRARFDKDFTLKNANSPVPQDFFKHLPAFAIHRIMGDKDRIIMMKRPISHAGSCNMRNRIITLQAQNAIIAGQNAIHR